jgi:PAS domain S-box-containing protein
VEIRNRLELLVSELEEFVIVLLDNDGIFQTWHPGVERLFGYTEQEFIGQHMNILVPEPDHSNGAADRELAEAVHAGRSSDTRTLVKKNGEEVFVDGVTVGLFTETGKRAGFGKVIRDLTERQQSQDSLLIARDELKRANEHLERMTVELERSNEELKEFAHIASHDLSAPLTSTKWLVDLLEMKHSGQLDERGRDCVKRIGQGLDRMSALVDAVLAHAQAGQTPVTSSESTPVEEALYKALENLRSEISGSEAQIIHGALPDLLIAPEPLCRVFQNLISNAIKYRKPGVAPRIEITAEREHNGWRIGVRDNGIGIEAQHFDRIFIPMQRLHGPEIEGSGIGLATCKKIVGRAGGLLWVESEVGKGSCFYFVLPGE